MRGQRWRESRCCSCSTTQRGAPTALPLPGVRAVDQGAARCRGGPGWVGLRGGLGPILLAPPLSSLVQGTDPRKRAAWCFRWEFGSLGGRWQINFTGASYKTYPFPLRLREGGLSFRLYPHPRLQVVSTSYSSTAPSSTVATGHM